MRNFVVGIILISQMSTILSSQELENIVMDGMFEILNSPYIDGYANFHLLEHWRTDLSNELICPETSNIPWTCKDTGKNGCYAIGVHRRTPGLMGDENIVGELRYSLVSRRHYCLSLDISYSSLSNIFFDSVDVVFLYLDFTRFPFIDFQSFVLNLNKQDIISVYTPISDYNWHGVSTKYSAKGGENYIYLGIMPHVSKNISYTTPSIPLFDSYICIDNVVLYDCTEGIEFGLPNVFTPNGDGENDVYRAEQFNVDKVEWVVLNRWGQGVNAGSGPVLEWDGRDVNSGQELAEGVYFIRATAYGNDGSTRTEQQTVHLMR
ncbi:hypothetical protein GC167_10665 [bacterium]|nr:hypothetical protein [bacterium]